MSILAISSSPRRHGNSERLLDETIAGAESVGARVEKAILSDFEIGPCRECGGCQQTGCCVTQDDYEWFYTRYFSADRIILATPVFFMSVSAQAKCLIDRAQSLWARKYIQKKRIPAREGFPRRGYLVATGGSGLPVTFDCPRVVAKYYYMTLDMTFAGDVCVNGLNDRKDIERHPEEIKAAYELGMQAALPGA